MATMYIVKNSDEHDVQSVAGKWRPCQHLERCSPDAARSGWPGWRVRRRSPDPCRRSVRADLTRAMAAGWRAADDDRAAAGDERKVLPGLRRGTGHRWGRSPGGRARGDLPPHQAAPAELAAAADRLGLPLLTVPDWVPFIAVTNAVYAHLAAQEQQVAVGLRNSTGVDRRRGPARRPSSDPRGAPPRQRLRRRRHRSARPRPCHGRTRRRNLGRSPPWCGRSHPPGRAQRGRRGR